MGNIWTSLITLSLCMQLTARPIGELLSLYQRSITVLEIAENVSEPYLAQYLSSYQGSYIFLSPDINQELIEAYASLSDNIILLNPPTFALHDLETLGSCEHFDIVLVHASVINKAADPCKMVELICKLADHIYIKGACQAIDAAPHKFISITSHDIFYYQEIGKKELIRPRWTSLHDDKKKYEIQSTFTEKTLRKQPTNTVSQWLSGINLVTFIMLRGIYPTDTMIRRQLDAYKTFKHNDLIIGNFIVQGAHITPIDFADKRHSCDPGICIKAAKKVFRWSRRFHNPLATLTKYCHYLSKREKPYRY